MTKLTGPTNVNARDVTLAFTVTDGGGFVRLRLPGDAALEVLPATARKLAYSLTLIADAIEPPTYPGVKPKPDGATP